MKKLLFQFDTDHFPSTFDTVVAYDGGADQVISHGGLTAKNVSSLVEGTIFTRPPKQKRFTAIFIGGSDLTEGERVLSAVTQQFFGDFRVSVMLDASGCNTTAAAAVARLAASRSLAGKKAVILAGTGPVGQRAAAMLAKEGAEVAITSRQVGRARQVCESLGQRFGVTIRWIEAADIETRAAAIAGAHVVFAAGAAGIRLLDLEHWQNHPTLELLADANATPPLGIGGTEMMDRGTLRHGKAVWGAIGFGPLKLALHRACIARLFEQNDLILDAEEIYAAAKRMA